MKLLRMNHNGQYLYRSSKIFQIDKRHFSIIHNYHCPRVLFSGIREFINDENITEYNKYIQAFLNKRFTHKKEVPPKISILNTSKEYHNTLYIQQSYPFYTLFDIQNMKFMRNLNILDTGYFISRFFEEYEKNLYDAVLSKILVCGRVEFMEDQNEFNEIKKKINSLVKIFYDGDPVSFLERDIERSYIILKMQKFNELRRKYIADPKLKREEIFVSYSELNKSHGHINFRMHHPEYNFKPCPIFEKIDLEKMFYNLYEIRYNSLNKGSYFEKLKLKFQYRKSLINETDHRTKFLSNYLFTQIIQYIDSWEFNNFFDLNLNFKVNLNLAVLHTWFIINQLNNIYDSDIVKNSRKFSKYLIQDLIERLINYTENNQFKFELYNTDKDSDKMSNTKYFIYKLLDQYTFHFHIFNKTKENNFLHLPLLLNGMIFNNHYELNDKNLQKFSLYVHEHYNYFSNLTYKQIETNDFYYSVYRVPINYKDYITRHDDVEFYNYNSYSFLIKDYFQNSINEKEINEKLKIDLNQLIENFKSKKYYLLTYQKSSMIDKKPENIINEFGIIPYEDKSLFKKCDFSKNWLYRVHMFFKNENDIEKGLIMEKVIYYYMDSFLLI